MTIQDEIEKIYTPLEVAKEEIWRRWNDVELRKKVEIFLKGDVPEFLRDKPRAIYVRDIISPNHEFRHFLELVKKIELEAMFIEYLSGKFIAKNFNKYSLCKMFFLLGVNKKKENFFNSLRIVDFNKMEGKSMREVEVLNGTSLVDFHHYLLKETLQISDQKISDFSVWFNRHRVMGDGYYVHYLALFLVHGILFDNFIEGYGEKEFLLEKTLPSYKKIESIFGIRPLIVSLTPIEGECDPYWWYYPASVRTDVEKYFSEDLQL